ncbi:MAG: hypothetical protein GWO24_26115, partial [Akkermansiaceae bacterium]|nr:hypothetical protein [Akkermansiaceae bacterium]
EFVPVLSSANLVLNAEFASGPAVVSSNLDPGSGGANPSLTVAFDEPVD